MIELISDLLVLDGERLFPLTDETVGDAIIVSPELNAPLFPEGEGQLVIMVYNLTSFIERGRNGLVDTFLLCFREFGVVALYFAITQGHGDR